MNRFLAIGHITCDIIDGKPCRGGSVYYSAHTAVNYGYQASCLTAGRVDDLASLADEPFHMVVEQQSCTTTFEHRYDQLTGQRVFNVLHQAPPISLNKVAQLVPTHDVLLVCPVLNEAPPAVLTLSQHHQTVGLFAQGWLRTSIWPTAQWFANLQHRPDLIVVSREDMQQDMRSWQQITQATNRAVLTDGPHDMLVWDSGLLQQVTLPRTVPSVDPTGAGDIFGTVLLLCLHEGTKLRDAVKEASVAASFAVEAHGLIGLPKRKQVKQFLDTYTGQ